MEQPNDLEDINYCFSKNKTSIGRLWSVTKRRPDLSGYQVPGSNTYVSKKNIPALQKQVSRSSIGYDISNSARNVAIIWFPHVNKVIAWRDVRVDKMSSFSWKDMKNPESVSSFEDIITISRHEDRPAFDQLVEDLMENQLKI
ncbi:hypothetical protein GcM1_242149 [Golovinomyces cichoracearum]|uniref:Uncharacterized protein n=1 Tax=Golovinomyces cichoracearum TaxID=62708 RepID=A0A420IHF0_9PEZI|nr:hypothetical protein GcM1_242149 [Golovinomyces cichoracearum]